MLFFFLILSRSSCSDWQTRPGQQQRWLITDVATDEDGKWGKREKEELRSEEETNMFFHPFPLNGPSDRERERDDDDWRLYMESQRTQPTKHTHTHTQKELKIKERNSNEKVVKRFEEMKLFFLMLLNGSISAAKTKRATDKKYEKIDALQWQIRAAEFVLIFF